MHAHTHAAIVPVALHINLYPVGGRKLGQFKNNIPEAHPQQTHVHTHIHAS